MGWETGYLQASFRGVLFQVQRAATEGGRRFAEHEFPRTEFSEGEDLGGISKRFIIDAYLIGDDYFSQRTKFEKALDEGTVGILVHPYRGTSNVKVAGRWRAVESDGEGGMVRYSIPFIEEMQISATRAGPSTRWIARSVKDRSLSSAISNFIDIFALANKPAAAVRDAMAAMDYGLQAVDGAKRLANSSADFKRQLQNCKGKVIALQANLESIANTFSRLIDWGGDDLTDGRSRFLELREISTVQTRTFGEVISAINDPWYPSNQATEFIAQLATISQVGVFPDVEFTTVDDAEELRTDLIKSIDDLSDSPTISDDLFGLLRDCKVAAQSDFDSRSMAWPRIREVRVPETTNTLALLYSEYGDIEDEEAFLRRNDIMHPGFVPGGVDLKLKVR